MLGTLKTARGTRVLFITGILAILLPHCGGDEGLGQFPGLDAGGGTSLPDGPAGAVDGAVDSAAGYADTSYRDGASTTDAVATESGTPIQPDPASIGRCPRNLPGPSMVEIPTTPSFCIDTTEVTQQQYAQFLASGRDAGAGPPACISNDADHTPKTGGGCTNQDYRPAVMPNHPVVCVSWCDAHAYCRWAGKRLCGRVGGGQVLFTASPSALDDEWYVACSGNGTSPYPYGDQYVAGRCPEKGESVQSRLECHGTSPPFSYVFDMSGGIGEWHDACSLPACSVRGFGAARLGIESYRCDSAIREQNIDASYYGASVVGFRCCADP